MGRTESIQELTWPFCSGRAPAPLRTQRAPLHNSLQTHIHSLPYHGEHTSAPNREGAALKTAGCWLVNNPLK